ncbi:hypothetical protein [Tardiphaga sp.]|uniref:hypothetical protein n=1 Tax=Tardiphaga sp. TaxID=1926292 RepID=UPI00352A6B2C
MSTSNPQQLGTVNGVPIVAELGGGLSPEGLARVTLSANYVMANPPGYPTRPPADGEYSKRLWPTVPSGTTCNFLKPEAAALVAAGAAIYA